MFPDANFYAQDVETVFTRQEQRTLANHIVKFGEINLEDDHLIFLEVELKPDSVNLAKNRVGLRKLIDNEVIAGLTDGAIITYYQPGVDEWRFTFYSERYGWDEDGNTIKQETHPKRYTYVVGPDEPCKTAAGQLVQVINKGRSNTLETVMKAFSIQRVSKEFFKEYKEQYDKFVGHLTGKIWTKNGVKEVGDRISQFHFFFKTTSDHEKEARDFVKKLLGRIVFLYFVQKKQWLGAESTEFKDGKPDFIYDLFKQVPEGSKDQFYSQWLTRLFFDTLNRDDDHAFEMPDGSTVYIPFLNGGLFEKDETDHNTESLPLPGELFSNPDDTESPNTRGFLDFLSAYNFTIHEDSPGDHTIAVDPEMLGHIFENLLEDNKDKGAYYTPKPIVHYMCQESLIEYLLTELTAEDTEDSEKEDLRGHLDDLIKKQEAGELVSFTEPILKSLREVKVCDPAIGSGAFPMGILQEIYQAVETLHHLSPDNVQAIWELPDEDWHPAEVKKQIIQNSIYGVDIEKGAVDIARLRFWLSLIVDEEEPTALPNLDYKIVVGDSLVSRLKIDGEEQVVNLNWEMKGEVGSTKEHLDNLREALKAIEEIQHKYFDADTNEKELLKNEIERLKIEALIHQLHFDKEYYKSKTSNKGGLLPTATDIEHNQNRKLTLIGFDDLIKKLSRIKNDRSSSFQYFDWRLDFSDVISRTNDEDKGFDIVIANPPWVQSKIVEESYKDHLKKVFKTAKGQFDYFNIFIELGTKIKSDYGYLCYIVPDRFINNSDYEHFRKFVIEETKLKKIVHLGDGVFEDVNMPCAIIELRNKDSFTKEVIFKEQIDGIDKPFDLDLIERLNGYVFPVFSNQNEYSIKEKIEIKSEPFGKYFDNSRGVEIGKSSPLIYSTEKENTVPFLRGEDIGKYRLEQKKWLKLGDQNTNYKSDELYRGDKILVRKTGTGINATIDKSYRYFIQVIYVFTPKHNLDVEYYLGLLNSRLIEFWYFKTYGQEDRTTFPHLTQNKVLNIPVPKNGSERLQNEISDKVTKALLEKEANPDADTTALEQHIDTLVYKLYNLTWEEVKVVDPEFGLSEEEYENFSTE